MSTNTPIEAAIPFTEAEKEICRHELNKLISNCKGLLTCVAASVDGFVVAEASLQEANGERLAAMSSSATAVADAVISELGYEKMEAVVIDASKGKIIVLSAPTPKQDLVFLCACNSDALIGQVLYSTKSAVNRIIQAFSNN